MVEIEEGVKPVRTIELLSIRDRPAASRCHGVCHGTRNIRIATDSAGQYNALPPIVIHMYIGQ